MPKFALKPTSAFCLLLCLAVFSAEVSASTYVSRITLGSFISNETFNKALDGQNENDFAIISSRFFIKATEVGAPRLELTADIRDKYDFFEKLNKELLTLTGQNTLQARQLSVKYPNETRTWYAVVGRFPVTEAGAVYLDGAELGCRWNPSFRTSLFAGLNPKQQDKSYLETNAHAQNYGTYTVYQPKSQGWENFLSVTNAAVAQMNSGHLDRAYWYNSSVYQWKNPNQISSLIYLDFTPRVYFQTALLTGVYAFTPMLLATANIFGIDVIEYFRRQSVLERLPASPYKEANLNLRQRVNKDISLLGNLAWGIRGADSLIRREVSGGAAFDRILNAHFSAQALTGYRRNFTADEFFLKFNGGYYAKEWEITLDQEFNYRKESGPTYYHPMVTELGVAHFFNRELYAALALQHAHDEKVDIWSTFLRVGARFGSEAVPPLRDSAPPRGKI